MSFTLDDLMDIKEQGSENTGSGGFKTIAKVKYNLGFQVYTGEWKYFPHKPKDKTDRERVFQEAKKVAKEASEKTGENVFVSSGVILTIHGDDVPTHPEGKFSKDWIQFINCYAAEEKGGNDLSVAEKELKGNTPLPYDATFEALSKADAADLFAGPAWVELSQVVDGWKKAKGNKRNYVDKDGEDKEAYYTIYVVSQLFASEVEAKEAALVIKGINDTKAKTETKTLPESPSPLSDLAIETGYTEDSWLNSKTGQLKTALDLVKQAMNGLDVEGNEMKKLTRPLARKYVATQYGVTVDDLDLSPF